VNFFGHAVAASWVDSSPAFGYGAMLPDLVSMVGTRRFVCDDPAVERGVSFHHLTDRCFHADPTFVALETRSRKQLAELGVRKGPRRALSHVGIELLLDAALARSPAHIAVYRAALQFGQHTSAVLVMPKREHEPLRALARILFERATQLVPKNALEATDRMARVLQHHPALSFDASEHDAVMRWTERAIREVDDAAESWISALQQAVTVNFEAA
jgi:hypothetical protein